MINFIKNLIELHKLKKKAKNSQIQANILNYILKRQEQAEKYNYINNLSDEEYFNYINNKH